MNPFYIKYLEQIHRVDESPKAILIDPVNLLWCPESEIRLVEFRVQRDTYCMNQV